MRLTDEAIQPVAAPKGVYLQIMAVFVAGAAVGAVCVSLGFLIGFGERSTWLASLEEPAARTARRPLRNQAPSAREAADQAAAVRSTPPDAGATTSAQPPSASSQWAQAISPSEPATVVTPQTAPGLTNGSLQAHPAATQSPTAGAGPANSATQVPLRPQPSQQPQARTLAETAPARTPQPQARQLDAPTLGVRQLSNQSPATRTNLGASGTAMQGQARLRSSPQARGPSSPEAALVGPHGTVSALQGAGQRPASNAAVMNQAGRGQMGATGVTVEVASTRAPDEATRLANVLKNLGYPVSVTNPQEGRGRDKSFHVQVGPYASRDGAEKVAQRLAMEGFKPSVPNPPIPVPDLASNPFPVMEQRAPAPATGTEGIFVDQVAADGSREEALQRVESLKARGYPAFLSTPQEARLGDRLFRVLVGPFPSRADAETARRTLEGQGLKPFVRRWRMSAGSEQR